MSPYPPPGPTIRGVLFDFHNTLVHAGTAAEWIVDSGGEDLDQMQRDLLVAVLPDVWGRAAARWPGATWDLTSSEHRRAFTLVLREDAGCSQVLADNLYATMPDQWRLAQGAKAILVDLHGCGVKLGIVSNIALDIRPALDEFGILALFDAVVLSFEVGMVKPNPAIFRLAADALALPSADCLMVGDTPEIDGAANRAGMAALVCRWRHRVHNLRRSPRSLAPSAHQSVGPTRTRKARPRRRREATGQACSDVQS